MVTSLIFFYSCPNINNVPFRPVPISNPHLRFRQTFQVDLRMPGVAWAM